MKRLPYIIVAIIVTITAFAGKSPKANVDNETGKIIEIDTVVSDSAFETMIDSMNGDTAAVIKTLSKPERKRHVSPVNNAATRTQNVNDAQGDSARMLERRRQRSIHYHDENGNTILIDTVTGQEWVDSTLLPAPPKMSKPLMYAVEIGANVWDPVMRLFGQKYGGMDFSATLNLHNRYLPVFEAGFGMAHKTPSDMNFTYVSPLAPYFKIGADYNFLYNSDPDYRFVAGIRYGFSAFRYTVEDVTFDDTYWGETFPITFPTQNITAGWFEVVLGLRVKIAGPISAGWMLRYHSLLHQTHPSTGNAWYVPGYGSTSSSITGSFSIYYTFLLPEKSKALHE